jgi:hypothetical protein
MPGANENDPNVGDVPDDTMVNSALRRPQEEKRVSNADIGA